ncbi:MAG: hypothetical protein ABWZ25_15860 [Chitinophagaceae bacterium]
MFDCNNLLHPFQHDPGTSQRQRAIDFLLAEEVKIDGRSMSHLLNYFVSLSTSIRYYNNNLEPGDWKPFFENSHPFLLAAISQYNTNKLKEEAKNYQRLFNDRPSARGLQLLSRFIFYRTIYRINRWYHQLKDSGLPVVDEMARLIRRDLAPQLKEFILLSNASARWFGIKRIDFSSFLDTAEDDVWGLTLVDLYRVNDHVRDGVNTRCELLSRLYLTLEQVMVVFTEAIGSFGSAAGDSINDSLIPVKAELTKNHSPHLAIVLAFIRLFQKMQGELNRKTKAHLKYFYTEVLNIKAAEPTADKSYILFEVQKIVQTQYTKYLLKKGTRLNAGRDGKNADIIFETDEELVVNETQVAALKTLYLRNEDVYDTTFLEGVYIAPDAKKSDGLEKDFEQGQPANWQTLGNKSSKYKAPGKLNFTNLPSARLGFVLASPVLYLAEGKREVIFKIVCNLADSLCQGNEYPNFYGARNFYAARVRHFLYDTLTGIPKSYIIINNDLLDAAVAEGMSRTSANRIRDFYLLAPGLENPCNENLSYRDSIQLEYTDWTSFLAHPANIVIQNEVSKIPLLFDQRYPVNIFFSGEKEWVRPSSFSKLTMIPGGAVSQIVLEITVVLEADKPAVTFYNKENLKEDLGIEMPAARFEIDDHLKIEYLLNAVQPECCLERVLPDRSHYVSLYHFFRNITVNAASTIDVKVCGLKNFIVQNDENLMDVNSPVYPFGSRPHIDSNFYIGSEEILLKPWTGIWININWKDLPPTPAAPNQAKVFETYYNGYQNVFVGSGPPSEVVEDSKFKIQFSLLLGGDWYSSAVPNCSTPNNDLLFRPMPAAPANPPNCDNSFYSWQYAVTPATFGGIIGKHYDPFVYKKISRHDVGSRNSFLKITLKCQHFQHDKYPFVLARQMGALGKLPEIIDGAVYFNINAAGDYRVMNINDLFRDIVYASKLANDNLGDTPAFGSVRDRMNFIAGEIVPPNTVNNPDQVNDRFYDPITKPPYVPAPFFPKHSNVTAALNDIFLKLQQRQIDIEGFLNKGVVIPNQPWTPVIGSMSLDYTATAGIDDMELIHLYPFTGSYRKVNIGLTPTLFPRFCDEGTLFIGLTKFQPGLNLNLLFQMAEATADSEAERKPLHWHYLAANEWTELRKGFEVIKDNTLALTASGIVSLALPAAMTNTNTVMPGNLYWIKVSMAMNTRSVSETIDVFTQAVSATAILEKSNDTARLSEGLEAGRISRLLEADASIKKVEQPFTSFGGTVPELDGGYYQRVSELLRHKNRAIQKWDYERIVLENYPVIFKAKCINHSYKVDATKYKNDIPYAPGFVLVALIPDFKKLDAGNSFEPKVPVSLLEKITVHLKKLNSPFVRLAVANPRYERVNFCINVRLQPGKDREFYKERLKSDLREYLSPWAIGKYEKLSFGQCVSRSDILRFLEETGYVDFVLELRMGHDMDYPLVSGQQLVCGVSPRSILVAGKIEVEVQDPTCENWCALPTLPLNVELPKLLNEYC